MSSYSTLANEKSSDIILKHQLRKFENKALTCTEVEGTSKLKVKIFFRQTPPFPSLKSLMKFYFIKDQILKKAQNYSNDDKEVHCIAGFLIAKEVSYRTGVFSGFYKEAQDVGDCDKRTHFDLSDQMATMIGAIYYRLGYDGYKKCLGVGNQLPFKN